MALQRTAGQVTQPKASEAKAVWCLTHLVGFDNVTPQWPKAQEEGGTPQTSFTSFSKEQKN